MIFYFAMNRAGQYLNANMMWVDDWPEAKRTVTVPCYDNKLIGYHEIFAIEDTHATGPGRPTSYRKVDTGEAQLILKFGMTEAQITRMAAAIREVAPTKREDFITEVTQLAEQFKPTQFKPYVGYNRTGDQLEIYLTDEPSHQRPVDVKSPGLLLQIGMESKDIVGFKVQCFLERLAGADPSVQAIMIDLEFAHTICDMYEIKIDQDNGPAWTWKREELEFFRTIRRLWPGMDHKFLQELPK